MTEVPFIHPSNNNPNRLPPSPPNPSLAYPVILHLSIPSTVHIPHSLTQCYTSNINISTVLTIPPYPLHFTKENKRSKREKGKVEGKLTPQLPQPQLEHCPLHAQEEQAHGAIFFDFGFFC